MRDWILEAIPAWYSEALCAQTDPEAFFPIRGGTTAPAKKICAACPVRQKCLDWSLEQGELHGVWGRVGYKARQKMLKERRAGEAA
jgi:WhiB family redox-sensing transcriptional regulator